MQEYGRILLPVPNKLAVIILNWRIINMDFKDQPFIPMLFGGDINTYSVARAFYEEYQVKTYVFGKFPSGPSYNSNIIEYHADLKIDTDDVFMKIRPRFCCRTCRQNGFDHRMRRFLCSAVQPPQRRNAGKCRCPIY